jgi:glutamate synthase (ferredoxin)
MSNHFLAEKDACGVGFIYRRTSTHRVITDALTALGNMEHRGACGGDGTSGDGAGILTNIPWDLFEDEGWSRANNRAVGMIYLPPDRLDQCRSLTEKALQKEGLSVVGWRPVPIDASALGSLARKTCPAIEQIFVQGALGESTELVEQKLMTARKNLFDDSYCLPEHDAFYVASLSTRTIVYKAMVKGADLGVFYRDLVDDRFNSQWALFHRRFSTNTLPRWSLAQPFAMLGHNGEINTLLGNRTWMTARQAIFNRNTEQTRAGKIQPAFNPFGSDSENLDDALEMLVKAGHSPEAALMQLIPEAHESSKLCAENSSVKSFYEYYSALQEPWDGPALVVYSDGITLGATMDRNGLRPARFTRLSDGSVILASETGIIDVPIESVIQKGRLGPGEMLSIDITTGAIRNNAAIKSQIASEHPYEGWLQEHRQDWQREEYLKSCHLSEAELNSRQALFGCGKEEMKHVISFMAEKGTEPIFSMGDDTPLAVLSEQPRLLTDYFRQRFAQVTNPAIDSLREKLVMSKHVYLGGKSLRLKPNSGAARFIKLDSPILNESELAKLIQLDAPFSARVLQAVFPARAGELSRTLQQLCDSALTAVQEGATVIVLSDRSVDNTHAAVPMVMAVGGVHQHLLKSGCRLDVSLIAETGQCWDVHQTACLLGFGAQAVCPYLAFEAVRHLAMVKNGGTSKEHSILTAATRGDQPKSSQLESLGLLLERQANYRMALEDGLLKVLSKMGITTMSGYIGAQIFECLGIGYQLIDRCFSGTASRIGGVEIAEVEADYLELHARGCGQAHPLANHGRMNHRTGGEFHGNNPELVRALHATLSLSRNKPDGLAKEALFNNYSQMVQQRPAVAIRDLLECKSDRAAIPVDQVEPACEIVKRFCTGGMSLGSLSKEVHEIMAIAMNRLGGKSNSGEGGEDPNRYYSLADVGPDGTSASFPGLKDLRSGDSAASAIRQVASGRFGVTPEYLATAKQLEIKVAQGAKPGEGGQLPGHKVSSYIAKLRRARPGVTLISPAPHHDIYSIEDLAQLIYDLRKVNPEAKISVKLVSTAGIGTIAAGVAKAKADVVQISGHDGGTGAAPLSSIKHAGIPWELGLAETQQALIANHLRKRVRIRVDGGFRTGMDVVMAAILGADEYGFGSIALIAAGCIMARICHTNNCPVGVTSQKESLRKRFHGSPNSVIEFFMMLAEEVRHTLARLGFSSLEEIIGLTDLLRQREDLQLPKGNRIDLNELLLISSQDQFEFGDSCNKVDAQDLESFIISDSDILMAIRQNGSATKSFSINNTDRTVGAKLSGELAKQYGDDQFTGEIKLQFRGTAGQSFGAFNHAGVHLSLQGEANDYVGKGMNGGQIAIRPFPECKFVAHENTIVGNSCLYGATGGTFYGAGRAGERFAVRNSQARAVIEGAGDHCCEYMTGGVVLVLGEVGNNFGAGMTGGVAYVFDEDDTFKTCFNADNNKQLLRLNLASEAIVRGLLEEHLAATGSGRAARISDSWEISRSKFWQIVPPTEVTADQADQMKCLDLNTESSAA